MPTLAEQEELIYKCTWEWTTQNSVNGYKVTGPNGKSIFLPAAGFYDGSSLGYDGGLGTYWSSTPYNFNILISYCFYFNSDHYMSSDYRYYGRSVRPVSE